MPSNYPEIYFPVLVQILIAAGLAAVLILISTVLGKRARSPLKDTPEVAKFVKDYQAKFNGETPDAMAALDAVVLFARDLAVGACGARAANHDARVLGSVSTAQ